MSRSAPTAHINPNPAKRFIEWSGSDGHPKYYDREKKENVNLPADLTFLVLDELCTIKGWHDASDSGIHSNEIRDTRNEPFVVRAFKGGTIAEGFYRDIKDKVNAHGGNFTANIYIGIKIDGELALASIQFKGAALNAWVDFRNEHRDDIGTKAIRIKGFTEGKKGKIVFRTPVFHIVEITPDTNEAAIALDRELQAYLKGYFGKNTAERVAEHDIEPREPEASELKEIGAVSEPL